jgi:hypothetical protein
MHAHPYGKTAKIGKGSTAGGIAGTRALEERAKVSIDATAGLFLSQQSLYQNRQDVSDGVPTAWYDERATANCGKMPLERTRHLRL